MKKTIAVLYQSNGHYGLGGERCKAMKEIFDAAGTKDKETEVTNSFYTGTGTMFTLLRYKGRADKKYSDIHGLQP